MPLQSPHAHSTGDCRRRALATSLARRRSAAAAPPPPPARVGAGRIRAASPAPVRIQTRAAPRLCVACSPRPPAPPAEPPRRPRPRSSAPPSRPVDLGFEGKIQWPHRAHPPATRSEGSTNAHQGEHAALAGPRTPPSPSSSSTSRKDLECALQAILQVVFQYAKNRPVFFSSFYPDAARMMRELQSLYPISRPRSVGGGTAPCGRAAGHSPATPRSSTAGVRSTASSRQFLVRGSAFLPFFYSHLIDNALLKQAAGDRCKVVSDGNEYLAGSGGASAHNSHNVVE